MREAAKAAKTSVVDNVMIDLTNDGDDTFATHGISAGSSWLLKVNSSKKYSECWTVC